MITFHNDHLMTPVFCKLIYDTVPEKYHIPIVFTVHGSKGIGGRALFYDAPYIEICLQTIFYYDYPGEARLWRRLLRTTYHEFGHFVTYPNIVHLQFAYDLKDSEYRIIESMADDYADRALGSLAEHDRRLAQPPRLGSYFDGRIVKAKSKYKGCDSRVDWRLKEYRLYKSGGGQLTAAEVASKIESYRYPRRSWGEKERYQAPDTRLIRRLAEDLAYIYIDKAGRRHMYFAWGDVPIIGRRVARYKSTHGIIPSEKEYITQEEERRRQYKSGDWDIPF